MSKQIQKILSWLLTFVMLFSMMPTSGLAAGSVDESQNVQANAFDTETEVAETTNGVVPVTIVEVDGSTGNQVAQSSIQRDSTIAAGTIKQNAPAISGYTYQYAFSGSIGTAYVIWAGSYDGVVYYNDEASSGVATRLDDGKRILLCYTKDDTRVNVTYTESYASGNASEGNSVEGAETLNKGSGLSFKVTTDYGYKATVNVTDASGKTVSAGYTADSHGNGAGTYTVSAVSSDLTVKVVYSLWETVSLRIKSAVANIHKATFQGQYTVNNGDYNSNRTITSATPGTDGATITFTISTNSC